MNTEIYTQQILAKQTEPGEGNLGIYMESPQCWEVLGRVFWKQL